jgi:hypothetical protein
VTLLRDAKQRKMLSRAVFSLICPRTTSPQRSGQSSVSVAWSCSSRRRIWQAPVQFKDLRKAIVSRSEGWYEQPAWSGAPTLNPQRHTLNPTPATRRRVAHLLANPRHPAITDYSRVDIEGGGTNPSPFEWERARSHQIDETQ